MCWVRGECRGWGGGSDEGLKKGSAQFAADVQVGDHACFGRGCVGEQDFHPSRKVPDLTLVTCSSVLEVFDDFVGGIIPLLHRLKGFLSGGVEVELFGGVGTDVFEDSVDVSPLKLHVSFEAVCGGGGDVVDVSWCFWLGQWSPLGRPEPL